MQVLRLALRRAGFEATGVGTGGQALQELDHSRVAAVVLDLGLPDGRADEVLARLSRDEGQAESPRWIVLSALDPADVEKRYGPLGDRLVPKPFDAWKTVRRIEDLLRR